MLSVAWFCQVWRVAVPGCANTGDICMTAKEVIPPLPYAVSLSFEALTTSVLKGPPIAPPLSFRRVRRVLSCVRVFASPRALPLFVCLFVVCLLFYCFTAHAKSA